ncbi:MAG: SulP family inorganic anion transporter [Schleiferiaceae bacterium]|nr:SulP family inorganic anion transporter [Schleiferiaceae bacterium]MDG2110690.1 SulP family inorganic anion transporter [Schleiferiaceae bacterium]
MLNHSPFANLKQDAPSSLVVFLVALPLCLGIALASGAPLFSGLIAGIIGGLIVAPLSGSPLGVSGPAAGLAVIVYGAIEELGAYPTFLAAVVVAGIVQVLLGVLKAGVIGYYFPSSVIKGMLSGIGIIIFLKQIPHAFGYDVDPEGDMSFIQQDGHNTFSEFKYMMEAISPSATLIAGLGLLIMILWERPFMKKLSFTTIIQGPLVAVVTGILLKLYFDGKEGWELIGDHLVSLPETEGLSGFIGQFSTPDFSAFLNPAIYTIGITMAVVASLETLLCVEATDKLDPYKRVTPTNRELLAQGAGNILSGLVGGLPITQVIVRSSANIQSGGRTKASATLHGALLLISAFAIPSILNLIPLAALAAILLIVGYKLAKPSMIVGMWKKGSNEFIPFAVTVVGIVLTDLLMGIALGLVVAIVSILWDNFKVPYKFDIRNYNVGAPIKIEFSEVVSFLNKASIQQTLNTIPPNSTVLLDASQTLRMHPDVHEIIQEFQVNAASKDITLELIGFEATISETPMADFEEQVLQKPRATTSKVAKLFKKK